MAILSGRRLGPYQFLSAIGAGGMGEVYEARDTKLGRNVAIKVLPAAFANDPERLARFQREAKMLAALNHPNIATIYGLENSDGVHFLIMELVPGETLANWVRSGPAPVEQALKIAVQIAEALEAAHEKNIIHRDLKPANVKLTPEGRVKVLDFGLAKAFEGESSGTDLANSPTLSQAATMQGVILGTAAYMSPEQARGKSVDKRTDVWAFGCVLYEMLTGKAVFDGEDTTEILAAVVKTEPDWSRIPGSIPLNIRALLRRCLQKDKTLRMQAAGDARIEIQEVLTAPASAESLSIGARQLGGWRLPIFVGLSALVVAAIAGFTAWNLKPAPPAAVVSRAVINLPSGDQLGLGGLNVALSEDGAQLAYVGLHDGIPRLNVRALDSFEAKPIPGTEGAYDPFFSPDGQWIGFFAQGKMKKVPVGGGAPVTLCDAASSGGASWGPDDTIVFSPSALAGGTGLWRIPASGGKPTVLTTPDPARGEYSHRYPQILPGGKAVVFTALNGFGWDESRIEVLRLDSGERRILVRGGHTGRILPSGQLVYFRAGALLALPFDLARLEVKGNTPTTVPDGVRQSTGAVGAAYSVSAAGLLAYIPSTAGARQFRLAWVDRQGKTEALSVPARNYDQVELSPDGQQAAVSITSGTEVIWIYDLARGTFTQLTSEEHSSRDPVWTPDGRRIAYRSNKAGNWNLYWRLADGTGSEERLTTGNNNQIPNSWSADGKVLAFMESSPTTSNIWTLSLEAGRKVQPFLQTSFDELNAQFSPDAHWLAYDSDESGGFQVYVQPYPGRGRKWQISTDGGFVRGWNPNGREIFYRDGNKTMVVNVTTSPSFSASKPRVLYDGPTGSVSHDGQRFLAVQPVEPEQPTTQINLVLNWFEELKQKVPTGKK